MDYDFVDAALAKDVKDRRSGRHVGSGQETLAAYLDQWLESAIADKPAETYSSYMQMFETHIKTAHGDVTLAELTSRHVKQMLSEMRTYDAEGNAMWRPVSARSRQYTVAILRSALNCAVRWQVIDHNAALSNPPHVKKR